MFFHIPASSVFGLSGCRASRGHTMAVQGHKRAEQPCKALETCPDQRPWAAGIALRGGQQPSKPGRPVPSTYRSGLFGIPADNFDVFRGAASEERSPFGLYPIFKIRGLTYNSPPTLSVPRGVFSSVQIGPGVAEGQGLVATLGEEDPR